MLFKEILEGSCIFFPQTESNFIKPSKDSGKAKLDIKNHHLSMVDITTWASEYFGKPLSSTVLSYINRYYLKLYCPKKIPQHQLLCALKHLG